ncbi:hypothetical protein [Neobacillus massiliamazoniensis]|uniref:Uncharacterized protein n=1 Tax=Neobacillus massiliamazoniensis TaxID=1499688 RepID=A0A0U1NZ93_9BACI|nr:hypothetical protein [Neobacillus massiliamazoniensis]CRK83152.1 hypothetical protein BN000_03111 [Neobacillus massiliamazoniensis]
MKKILTSVFTVVLLLGLGTGVMAASDKLPCKMGNFKEMLPAMKEKFPNLSEKDLKEKHKNCVEQMKKDNTSCSMMQNSN